MIQAILFDLDGTLLDRNSSLIVYVHHQINRCKDLLEGVAPTDYLDRVIELDAHGHRAKEVVFQNIEKDFCLPVRSWERLFNNFITYFPDTCVPFPKMHQTLMYLTGCGFSLGLITNGSNVSQNPKIDGLGIRPYFDAVLVSEAEGIKKPDPEIFHRALQKLKVDPKHAVFVGDNPEADIHAAKAVGMQAIWMQNLYWSTPIYADATITQLYELPEILEAMSPQVQPGISTVF